MDRLKVRTRLAIAFGLVLLITAAIALFGVVRLGTLRAAGQQINGTEMQEAFLAEQWRANININLVRTFAALKSSDPAFVASLKADSDKTARDTTDILKKMDALINDKEGDLLVEDIAKNRDSFKAMRENLLSRRAAGEDLSVDVERDFLPLTRRYVASLDRIVSRTAVQLAAAQADTDSATSRGQWALGLGAALSTLLGLGLSVLVTRSVLRQLGCEPSAAARLAHRVAAGDLSEPIALARGDSTSLLAQFKDMQDSLSKVVKNVRQNAEGVATASAQIAQGNLDLSQRTEEQASALEQTAASMEQLGSTVKLNADNAHVANQLALSASGVAVKGGDVVRQVIDTMKGINDSSRKIGDIISVIDGIAFQTNILALNAAVEAARAGEQGRGFAVVASEVRSLAGRSADAAKEIKGLINASVEQVSQGTTLVDQAGETMTEVVASIKRVTDLMGEISNASAEQSKGVAQVGEAVSQMDQVTQQNAALVEESAAAAMSLKSQALQLVEAVAVFRLVKQDNHSHAPMVA
jgi:methyl-accepting chemotaxis protein